MTQDLNSMVEKLSKEEPASLQKKRTLALMLRKRLPKLRGQDKWISEWEELPLVVDKELRAPTSSVEVLPLLKAINHYPELLQENLMEKAVNWQDNQLNAMHIALLDAGEFVYVPDNSHLDTPLNLHLETRGKNPHQLIIVGAGATVHIKESSIFNSRNPLYYATEILLGTGARVFFEQEGNYQSTTVNHVVHAYQARSSQLNIKVKLPTVDFVNSSFYSFLDGPDTNWHGEIQAFARANQEVQVKATADGYGNDTKGQLQELGWEESDGKVEFGSFASANGEPLTLEQTRIVGKNGSIKVDDHDEVADFKDKDDFFNHFQNEK